MLPLSIILAFAPSISAQGERTEIQMLPYPFLFSHLSPLITYYPADAWTHNNHSSNTTSASATATFQAQGPVLIVNGGFRGGAKWKAEPEFAFEPDTWPREEWIEGDVDRGEMLWVTRGERAVDIREITLTNGDEGDELSVQRVQQFTNLPAIGNTRPENITRQSAVQNDGAVNPFFSGSNWEVNNSPAPSAFNTTNGTSIPSVWFAEQFRPPFITNSTLTTFIVNSPLQFTIPVNTAFIQWYGTVGPDFGEFEIRLNPQDEAKGFPFVQDTYKASAERSIESGMELLMIAYTDPRLAYDAEIVLLEDGKKVDVNGIFTATYTADPVQLGSGDFVKEYNDRTSGAGRTSPFTQVVLGVCLLVMVYVS